VEVTYETGTPAQGHTVNSKPPALFPNHMLAIVNGVYYDPSYGRTYSSLQDMENQVINGYFKRATTTLNGATINCLFFKQKESSHRLREMRRYPDTY